MTDLISKSAVLAVGNVRKVVEYDEAGYDMTYDAVPVEAIEALPAVDAVPVVHGHIVWKDRLRGGVRKVTGRDEFGVEHTVRYMESYVERTPYCSVCTKVLGDALTYCPNCGAKMDTEEDR